eukprot:GHVQ01039233.1.p1 GENE.GHVQ01039233.1~~GHVQ01039233.1.p1  ORF type:complete len:177 (+),score=4.50 GHVQ01039233.1:2234-2764(+)
MTALETLHKVELVAVHIAGKLNETADELSRFSRLATEMILTLEPTSKSHLRYACHIPWHVPIAIAPDNKCLQDHIDKLKRVISYASKREATMVLLHPDSFAAAKTTTVATESFTMNRRTLTAIRRPQLIARTFGSTIASRFRFKGSLLISELQVIRNNAEPLTYTQPMGNRATPSI